VSEAQPIEFAPAVLRSLRGLVPSGTVHTDLALELGLSAWLRKSGTGLEDAHFLMLEIRRAVLEAADMDAATEPVPLCGRSQRLDVLNLAVYLGNLIDRAGSWADCGPEVIVERAIACLSLDGFRPAAVQTLERRSS
jgi:hypothetical protein